MDDGEVDDESGTGWRDLLNGKIRKRTVVAIVVVVTFLDMYNVYTYLSLYIYIYIYAHLHMIFNYAHTYSNYMRI